MSEVLERVMAAFPVRTVLGDRIRAEMDRKVLSVPDLASKAGIPVGVLVAYLEGRREIQFQDLDPICAVLEVPLMTVLCRPGSYDREEPWGSLPDWIAEYLTDESYCRSYAELLSVYRRFPVDTLLAVAFPA